MKPLFLQENYELQRFKEKWWKPQQCQVNKKKNFPQGYSGETVQ